VARVALEVVDSSWCKQQLRLKSAGSGTTALSSNEGVRPQPLAIVVVVQALDTLVQI
jgi:hypothetical protein